MKILILGLISFYIMALILTFSRGYWFGAVIGICVLLLLLRGKSRIELICTLAGIAIIVIVIFLFTFGNFGSSMLTAIVLRVGGNSLNVIQDPALNARYVESWTVLQYISMNPIIGYGLGSSFYFYNPIHGTMFESLYVHNGYLFLWFKLGIIGLSLFFMTYVYQIREAIATIARCRFPLDSYLLRVIISLLVALLAISITSPQFITRDSILVIVTCWALIGAYRYDSEKE
jgi:O-antigen ligase